MNMTYLICCLFLLAISSYLPRILPFLLFREKMKHPFMRSFLSYMPYGMLSAMIFPSIFTSTRSIASAIIALLVALLLAYKKLGLLPVACGAVLTVFLIEQLPFL